MAAGVGDEDEWVFRNRLHAINNVVDFDKNLPSPVRWPAAPSRPAVPAPLLRSLFLPIPAALAIATEPCTLFILL